MVLKLTAVSKTFHQSERHALGINNVEKISIFQQSDSQLIFILYYTQDINK